MKVEKELVYCYGTVYFSYEKGRVRVKQKEMWVCLRSLWPVATKLRPVAGVCRCDLLTVLLQGTEVQRLQHLLLLDDVTVSLCVGGAGPPGNTLGLSAALLQQRIRVFLRVQQGLRGLGP